MAAGKKEITDWYTLHSEAIFKYIFMMIRDYQEAEDLTHETFVKAYKSYHTFKYQANEKTWLYRIAHNVTIDYTRRRKPVHLIQELFSLKNNEATSSPEEIIEINESTKKILEVLGRLKQSYREVIILRKIKELSIKETAHILNWSESKVKSTLSRAIQNFEKRLEEEGMTNE